jgi:hypothetical protein
VTFRALQLVSQAGNGQVLADHLFLQNLADQDSALLPSPLLRQLEQLQPDDPNPLVLLDTLATGELSQLKRRGESGLTPRAGRWAQLGALFLAAIAAPCAAMVVLAPGAGFVGLGAVIAALMPLWKAVGMSVWPRILLTLSAVVIATINLIRAEVLHRRFRDLQRQVGSQLQLPRLQRRRLRLIRWSSSFVLALVAVEGLLRVFVMKMPLL